MDVATLVSPKAKKYARYRNKNYKTNNYINHIC